MFPGPLGGSLAGKALKNDVWTLETLDIRDFAANKHRNVDDTSAGGGPGMVMRADVIGAAIDDARSRAEEDWPLIYLSPRGKPLTQDRVKAFSKAGGVTLLCGRFEGVDQRVLDARGVEEVSIGDYVLSGGELGAMVLMDAVVRLLDGVLAQPETLTQESFEAGLLEYPQYTRPQSWEGHEIPAVLLSGHHKNIATWRREKAEEITSRVRPDLWALYTANKQKQD
jgi:tRNA (guanine37-N1)-methyltransferase